MSETLVSVIVPVFNVQDYIEECLASIAAQTYTDGVECIIIDDCGTDDSMLLAQRFLDTYQGGIRFRIVRHEHNRGLSAARNTGIHNACGRYVLFVDSDDTMLADCLQHLMESASHHPEAEMIAAGAKTNRKHTDKRYTMEKPLPDYSDNPEWIARTLLMRGGRHGIPVTAWNRLVRRDFILSHRLFFREGILHEDELWNFMLAQQLNRMALCRHDTYFRRIRPQSITTSFKTKDDDARSCLPVWHEMLQHFTPALEREQTISLWQFVNDISPDCRDRQIRKEVRGILRKLAQKGFWPTSILITIYLLPPVFGIKFLRKRIAKASRISTAHISTTAKEKQWQRTSSPSSYPTTTTHASSNNE